MGLPAIVSPGTAPLCISAGLCFGALDPRGGLAIQRSARSRAWLFVNAEGTLLLGTASVGPNIAAQAARHPMGSSPQPLKVHCHTSTQACDDAQTVLPPCCYQISSANTVPVQPALQCCRWRSSRPGDTLQLTAHLEIYSHDLASSLPADSLVSGVPGRAAHEPRELGGADV